ncbi:unnamed protein product, partial [marine sediment metagenome]
MPSVILPLKQLEVQAGQISRHTYELKKAIIA